MEFYCVLNLHITKRVLLSLDSVFFCLFVFIITIIYAPSSLQFLVKIGESVTTVHTLSTSDLLSTKATPVITKFVQVGGLLIYFLFIFNSRTLIFFLSFLNLSLIMLWAVFTSYGMRRCRSDWPGICLFFVINPRVLSANRVNLGFLFHKFSNFTPPPPLSRLLMIWGTPKVKIQKLAYVKVQRGLDWERVWVHKTSSNYMIISDEI